MSTAEQQQALTALLTSIRIYGNVAFGGNADLMQGAYSDVMAKGAWYAARVREAAREAALREAEARLRGIYPMHDVREERMRFAADAIATLREVPNGT
jgi:hypothetical protein